MHFKMIHDYSKTISYMCTICRKVLVITAFMLHNKGPDFNTYAQMPKIALLVNETTKYILRVTVEVKNIQKLRFW